MDDEQKAELLTNEIERQLDLDVNTLLTLLAAETLGATPSTPHEGQIVLENIKRTHHERICGDERVKGLHSATSNSRVLLVTALLDCIGGAVTGVSPITVCVLLVKEGLETLCGSFWSPSADP